MTTDKDGGPAYPHETVVVNEGHYKVGYHKHNGMSKLLWLAAHAPQTLDDGECETLTEYESLRWSAALRFKWAQAMLAEEARIMEGE